MSSDPDRQIRSWQYGLLDPDPEDWTADCEDELVKQNTLWNKLIEIDRGHRTRVAALISTDPKVAALEAAIVAFDEDIAALVKERSRLRQQARAKIDTSDLEEQIKEKTAARKQLYAELKLAKTEKRERERTQLAELSSRRYDELTQARRQSGLWWGNYNAVLASFDAAVRALPAGGILHFHRWDGSGRITNQLQGGLDAGRFVTGRCHSQLWLEPLAADHRLCRRGAGKRGMLYALTVTVWAKGPSQRRSVTWPMVMHRPFPPRAIIKTVTISRRANPSLDGWRWRVNFACTIPAPAAPRRNTVAGIDTGWRRLAQGIRVGTIVDSTGTVEHIVLSQAWLDSRIWAAELQGQADEILNRIGPELFGLAAAGTVPASLETLWQRALPPPPARIRRRPLIELVRSWRLLSRSWQPQLRRDLETWLQHQIEFLNLLDKLSVRRREEYRIAAKAIADRWTHVGIDRLAVQRLAADKDVPLAARRLRSWAAPYNLASEIRRAILAARGTLTTVSGPTTRVCHVCGQIQADRLPETRSQLFWFCQNPKCQTLWDQDINAATNVLRHLTGSGGGLRTDETPLRPPPLYRPSRLTRKKAQAQGETEREASDVRA